MSQSLSARDGGASGSHLGDETLSAYLDGELDTHEVPPAASHLERCPSCRERLGSLSRAAESVGRPVRPVASSTRQLQLERALGGSTRLHLRDSVGRNRRRLVVARWAAALVMVAGGSASLWHFRSDLSGRSGPTASQTSARAGPGEGATPGSREFAGRRGAGAAAASSPGAAVHRLRSPARSYGAAEVRDALRRIRVGVVGSTPLRPHQRPARKHRPCKWRACPRWRRRATCVIGPVGSGVLGPKREVSPPRPRRPAGRGRRRGRSGRLPVGGPGFGGHHDRPGARHGRPRARSRNHG